MPNVRPFVCFWISKLPCSQQSLLQGDEAFTVPVEGEQDMCCFSAVTFLSFPPPAPVHPPRCTHLDAQQQQACGICKSSCTEHPLLGSRRGERQGLCEDPDCLYEGRVYTKTVCSCLLHAASPSLLPALLPETLEFTRKHSSYSTAAFCFCQCGALSPVPFIWSLAGGDHLGLKGHG